MVAVRIDKEGERVELTVGESDDNAMGKDFLIHHVGVTGIL